jgi:LPS-assembly protein
VYSRLLRALPLTLALLALPAAAAAQDVPSSCKGYERLAGQQLQVAPGHFRFLVAVEITCDTFKFFADHVDIYTDEDRLVATGNVLFTTPETRISASKAEFDLKNKTGVFHDATGSSKVKPQFGAPATMSMFGTQEADMHFWGEKLEKLGEKKYRLTNGSFTTCLQPTPRWEFTSGSVTINVDRYAVARNTTFRVKGVPMLYLPIIYYPLEEDDRATGFLLPSYGMSNFRGQTIRNAFFWAINRSSDLTLMHDFFSTTGNGYGAEFRYQLGPGSGARVTGSLLDEKAHVYRQPNGIELPRDASRTVQVRGSLTQQLPGTFRAGATADYTSNVTTRQLYESNVADFTNRQSIINGNVSGTLAGLQLGGVFGRSEIFYPDGSSTVSGAVPRLTVSRPEQRLAGLPIYWGVAGEGVGILSEGRTATTVVERNRFRADILPTVRAPLSRLAWLQATTALAWRGTWWSESLDASGVQVPEPISRNYFEMQANFVGPVFNRIFSTPGMGYAQRWKHVIEPALSLARTTGIDKATVYDRIVTGYDATDSIVGSVTRVGYGLTNRLYTKRGEATTGIARELAALSITQSYYTDPLAAARDQQYRNTFTGESLSSKFSPIVFALRVSPVDGSVAEFAADYDTQFDAIRQLRATTTFRVRQNLDVSGGWSQQRLILGLPGFSDPLSNAHSLNASSSLRTANNKYGGTYQFSYDILRSGFLNQRLITYYNAQCCGVGIEYQTVNLPTFAGVQGRVLDRRFNLSFTLAGIGSFSDFFGAFGADPYRR